MVDFVSRGGVPRREDERARRLIGENRKTIERLADQISGGGYSMAKAAKVERARAPVPDGLSIHDLGAGRRSGETRPYLRISPNNRVVVVDEATGRQMHFLGELRRIDGQRRFVLATRGNRFFTPVDEKIAAALTDLDGRDVASDADQRTLADEIGSRLGFARTVP